MNIAARMTREETEAERQPMDADEAKVLNEQYESDFGGSSAKSLCREIITVI